ncbi:MAG TPA: DUF4440 domain-containing protein [Candidatus Udaeobacter sp.]|nr:DUF4440 domain-containing protein [Candidatus Udaeobacter sp.]
MRWFLLGVSIFAIGWAGCQSSARPLTAADRAGIESTSQTYEAAAKGADWVALAATYTEDAILMPPNGPAITGRAAIVKFFQGFPRLTSFKLTNVEVEGNGDIAYVRGTYQLTMSIEGQGPIEDSGKFLEIRRKQPDSSWLIYRDMFSSDLPAPPSTPAPPTD